MSNNINHAIANSGVYAIKNSMNFIECGDEKKKLSPEVNEVNTATSEYVQRLSAGQDVRNMSPKEMAKFSQGLFDAGIISFKDHALLSFQPEIGAPNQGLGTIQPGNADKPRDYIAHWEAQLKAHEKAGETSFANNDRRILNILSNVNVR